MKSFRGEKKLKALSVHAHFYQPPRENPFTGEIPRELEATPFHDFNEKILAECYRPNALLGNFEFISFNVGATLINWLRRADPITYQRIIAQDRDAYARRGVGTAIAQPYFHVILPLANRHEKETQVYWGIRDFVRHFGRKPEGMWLPETAVDYETLEILATNGIKYTILAPWQAEEETLNTMQPYQVKLSNGYDISVFFYHQELSSEVSFHDQATANAHEFVADKVLKHYEDGSGLILIATDGELYGHHKKFRDWFLTYLLHSACKRFNIEVTTPGEWLREHPPRTSTRIKENTSWSCHHGIMRWMGDCACTPGNGEWKQKLRLAFNNLASFLDDVYVAELSSHGINPWKMRNAYIEVLEGNLTLGELLKEFSLESLKTEEERRLEILLMSQLERMRMFTSCGWFFDRFNRIETRNNISYAVHAIMLVKRATGIDYHERFRQDLQEVIRDDIEVTGEEIYLEILANALD